MTIATLDAAPSGRHGRTARRRGTPGAGIVAALAAIAFLLGPQARAAQPTHLGSMVVELGSGRVLHTHDADRALVPASLTKLMSAYVVLQALDTGEVSAGTRWTVSGTAASQPPSRFGFLEGEEVDVDTALAAMVVSSGNDAAVLVAEGVAGSEAAFVVRMNDSATRLGMNRTLFANASGLPAAGQRSTARDMATLARALWRRFPERARLFARDSVEYAGRRQGTTNPFISSYRGASGMKTGFTCRAGYNLVGSVQRAARHLVGVVMGAPTAGHRARVMRELMDRAFQGHQDSDLDAAGAPVNGPALRLPGNIIARTCTNPGGREQGPVRWTIDVGVKRSYGDANQAALAFIREWQLRVSGARPMVIPRYTGVDLFRAGVTGLSKKVARDTCLAFRDKGGDCIIMDTPAAKAQVEHARRSRRLGGASNGARS